MKDVERHLMNYMQEDAPNVMQRWNLSISRSVGYGDFEYDFEVTNVVCKI